jgi:uncharacterized protein (TIGR02246 family)
MARLTREIAVELFERRREAWLASDAEAYLALWTEDMVIEIPGRAEPIRGKTAYAKMIDGSMKSMRPVSWEFHSLAVDGDRVLAEWTLAGEFRAKKKLVSWRGMSICSLRDGLICEWREYWDPASLH